MAPALLLLSLALFPTVDPRPVAIEAPRGEVRSVQACIEKGKQQHAAPGAIARPRVRR